MLQKALVPVDFTGGLDTDSDPLLVQPGKLLAAENLCLRGGTLEKRPGSDALPDAALGASSLTEAEALAVFKGSLLRWTAAGLHAYAGGASAWTQKGAAEDALPLAMRRESVAQGDATLANHDCAVADGFTAYVWQAADGVYFVAADTETGVEVARAIVASAGAQTPRVVGVPGALVVLYARADEMYGRRFDTANPSAGLSAEVLLGGVLPGETLVAFDALAVDGNVAISAAISDGSITFSTITPQFTLPAGFTPNWVKIAGPPATEVSLGTDAAGNVFAIFRAGATLGVSAFTPSGAALLQDVPLASGYDARLRRIGVTQGAATVSVFLEVFSIPGETTAREVQRAEVDASGVVTPPAVFMRGVKLGGHPFVLGGRTLLPVLYVGALGGQVSVQPTAFVVDAGTGAVLARMLESISSMGQRRTSVVGTVYTFVPNRLSRVPLLPSGEACLVLGVRGRIRAERLGFFYAWDTSSGTTEDTTSEGLCRFLLSAPSPSLLQRQEHGDALVVAAAAPLHYDGAAVTEAGFHLGPEGLTVTEVGVIPSGISAGQYQWRAVYEWTDAQGSRVQSPPSPAVTFTATGGICPTITVPCLRLTRRADVRVVLYRTEAAGTLFYRCQEATNDAGADRVAILDGRADVDLLYREVLYTDAGLLDAFPPPAHAFSCVHGKRLVVGGLEDPLEWAYSQEAVKGEGLAFHEALRGRVPAEGGALTGLASMDGKLVLLCERAVHVVQGDGPNAAGGQNTFTEAQTVAPDVGCSDWRSVVLTPLGLIFKGARGFYLLSRSLQAQPIGAEVSQYDADTVTSAVLVPGEEEVRFTTQEGRTLVYHYGRGQWLVDTAHGGEDALVWGGAYVRAVGGKVLVESAAVHTDDGAAYATLARTAWLKLAGIQGAQRIWRALFVGALASDCTISISALYDYEDEEHVLVAGHPLTLAEYPGGVWQLRTHLAQQKCEAVSFVVRVASAGAGASLTNLTLEVGAKKGARKLSASRTA